jgi:excisionase family DNA binding protein
MNINDILQDTPSLNITINAGQLLEVVNYAISKTRAEFEAKRAPEQYLTRKQAAEMLDVDLSTLWRWNKDNYLCAVEVGGKRKYKLSDINRILGKGEVAI